MKKIFFIILDGLGDRPIKELGNKTPLEAAQTPNLDFLAKNGVCGLIEPFRFPKEKKPTSESTHVALFGFQNYFLGRGPYEVLGIGMNMKKGDIAFRVNFASIDSKFKIIDRRAGRIEKTQDLVKALQGIEIDGVKFLIKKSYGHRLGLIMRGKGLSAQISNGDSKQIGVRPKKIESKDKSKKAKFTADVLNKFLEKTYQILKEHSLNKKRKNQGLLSANYLLIRGAGEFKKTPTFKEKYKLRACCIAAGSLYKGIARALGMDLIKVNGATGFINTNLKGKISAGVKALKKYDFVFLHIKAADNLAEDGNFQGKKKFIEKIDKNLNIFSRIKNTLLIVTCDHSTPCELKTHSTDPVPVLVYGNKKDNVEKFTERDCKKGKLNKIKGIDFLKKFI